MFHFISKEIVNILTNNEILDSRNKDIYKYSIEILLLNSLLLIIFFTLSVLGKCINLFISFLIFFIPKRILSGGYHAKHSETCFLLSISIYVISIIISKHVFLLYTNKLLILTYLLGIIALILWSPLEDCNLSLTVHQYERNKKIIYIIVLYDIILFTLFYKRGSLFLFNNIIFTIIVSLFLSLGKILQKNNNNNS